MEIYKSEIAGELATKYRKARREHYVDIAGACAFALILIATAWVFTFGKSIERELDRKTAELDQHMCLDPQLFAKN